MKSKATWLTDIKKAIKPGPDPSFEARIKTAPIASKVSEESNCHPKKALGKSNAR